MDICLHGLYSPWFRAQQSLCSIVYFKLSLHIRMEELKGLMSSTGKISPRHGNPKIYPQIFMQPPSKNLLKIWWIIIGGGTSRYRVRSDSRHCSAMKNKHTWIETAVECIDKKGYIWWTHEQELDQQNIPICMQPRKKWECICIYITLLLCARVSQKWDAATVQHRKD